MPASRDGRAAAISKQRNTPTASRRHRSPRLAGLRRCVQVGDGKAPEGAAGWGTAWTGLDARCQRPPDGSTNRSDLAVAMASPILLPGTSQPLSTPADGSKPRQVRICAAFLLRVRVCQSLAAVVQVGPRPVTHMGFTNVNRRQCAALPERCAFLPFYSVLVVQYLPAPAPGPGKSIHQTQTFLFPGRPPSPILFAQGGGMRADAGQDALVKRTRFRITGPIRSPARAGACWYHPMSPRHGQFI